MNEMIALATSKNALELSEEDLTLVDTLGVLGVETKLVDWADPNFNWSRAGMVVIRSTWDYHLRPSEFLAWVDHVASVTDLVNPAKIIHWNANKRYLRELSEGGVPIVPTVFAQSGASIKTISKDREWPVVVIKPAIAAGAYETLVFELDSATDQAQAHLDRLTPHGEVLVQPYLDAITVEGETSLVCFEGAISHAVRKVPATGDFRVQFEHGGKYTVVEPTAAQVAVADLAISLAPETPVYARIDLVDIAGQPHLMELEMIEPELFFLFVPGSAMDFADILRERYAERLVG